MRCFYACGLQNRLKGHFEPANHMDAYVTGEVEHVCEENNWNARLKEQENIINVSSWPDSYGTQTTRSRNEIE